MRTPKQIELIETFLSNLDPRDASVYRELILHLSSLGYDPKKQRSAIIFNCAQHNKQIAKIGYDKSGKPFFALRFSACRGYSERFMKIVEDVVSGKGYQEARCITNGEDFCKGPPSERLYTYQMPDGEIRHHCGAKALAIPGLCEEDVPQVKRLMEEEHRFLMEYEAKTEETP